MELVYAALLLHEAGKEVNEDNLESVLDGADIDVDASEVKAAVAALEDVDFEDAMSQPAAAAPAAPADGSSEADEAEDEAEGDEEAEAEEVDDEEAEEAAEEGLGQLF